MLEVAIIGAGFSGIACAAAAQQQGLQPTILEQYHDIGGVWRPDHKEELGGAAWPDMQTNNSRITGTFSDFYWSKDAPYFPTKEQVYEYLSSYTDFHNLRQHIQFGCKVEKLIQQEQKWQLEWTNEKRTYCKTFDAVLIASGKYSNFYIPDFNGLESVSNACHAAQFRHPETYRHKKVLIVGGSLTGTSIAESLSDVSDKIIHLIRRERWLFPRSISCDVNNDGSILPHDLLYSEFNHKTLDSTEKKFAYMLQHCYQQNKIPTWQMTDTSMAGSVVITEYLNKVNSGAIVPEKGEILKFSGNKVFLTNGKEIDFDAVIFCTGYKPDLSFLPQKIKETVIGNDLFEDIFCKKFDNLAFVGMYPGFRGAVPPVVQLQAELACSVFANKINLPSPKERKAKIAQTPKTRAPIDYMNALAEHLNTKPDLNAFNLGDKYILHCGTFTSKRFRLLGDNKERVWKEILEDEMLRRELIQQNDKQKVSSLAVLCKKKLGMC